jgi:hypothetical protein
MPKPFSDKELISAKGKVPLVGASSTGVYLLTGDSSTLIS